MLHLDKHTEVARIATSGGPVIVTKTPSGGHAVWRWNNPFQSFDRKRGTFSEGRALTIAGEEAARLQDMAEAIRSYQAGAQFNETPLTG